MKVKFFKSNVRFFSQFETEVNLFLEWLEGQKRFGLIPRSKL
nr:MAG TPA: Sporulation protein Cse60 [Bacteriophage sp.]